MTSQVEHQHRTNRLCTECGKAEAVTLLKRTQKSRKAKRGRGVRLAHHDLCSRCWRALSAKFWVHEAR